MVSTNFISAAEANGQKWPARDSAWAKSFELFCKTVYRVYCPLTVHGLEYLPDSPFLICSNHTSHMDSTALMVAAKLPFQNTGLIAAKDYFFDARNRSVLHYMMNLVPIERGVGVQAIKDSVIACRSFLESGGKALIIFPEGTRSVSGQMARFKQGAAILAHNLDIPMVPARVIDADRRMPKGAYMFKPGRITVRFGKALRVNDWLPYDEAHDRRAIFAAYRDATEELETRVRALGTKADHV